MEKCLQMIRRIGLSIICSLVFFTTYATQLSGAYTIDSAGTPSTTVFQNFSSAVTYLTGSGTRSDGGPSNSSPFGVSGPVVFTVNQGTYTEQVTITAIAGVSATNTVTFDGGTGNAATRVLQYAATSTTDGHTLRFSGCTYVTVQNITILSTSASQGLGVHFYGACSFNTLKKCSVIVATSSSANFRAINCSGSNLLTSGGGCSGAATTSAINNIFIDSNYVSGGYYGVFLNSSGAGSGSYNFYIRGNRLFNAYLEAIGASGSYGYLIMGNYIKPTAQTSSIGFHHCNGSPGSQYYLIANNIFENCGQYGLYIQSPNAASAQRPKVVQNYFKPTFINAAAVAMSVGGYNYLDVWQNTILMNMAGGSGIVTTGSSYDIRNNIIILQSSSATGLCLSTGTVAPLTCNYNVYIKNNPASPDLITVGGSTYQAANIKGGGGYNLNSTTDNPMLVSPPSDIRPNNICQKGAALTINIPVYGSLTTDINGVTRTSPPQIGASEPAGGLSLDIAAVGFLLPAFPVNSGSQDIKVVIRNAGNSTITDYNVSVNLGATTNTISRNGITLGSCSTDTILFTGANQLTLASGLNLLRAWVANPNFGVDSNLVNDTIQNTFATTLAAGTYTIDPAGSGPSNFLSFGQADTVLGIGGISGPVIFQVAAATYAEQVDIPAVYGSSAVNTITFDGGAGNAATRIIQFSGTSSTNAHTLRFNGCSYVTFQNMTIKGLSTANAMGVHFFGASTFCTLKKCSVIVAANSTTVNVKAININNSTNAAVTYSGNNAGPVHDINIDSNYISGGNYGIYASSTVAANLNYRWNTLVNVYQYAFDFNSCGTFNILYNNVTMTPGNTTSNGIYGYNGGAGGKDYIVGNTFENIGQYGAFSQTAGWGTGTTWAYNYFKPTFSNAAPVALCLGWISGQVVQNNTILMNKTAGVGINDNNTSGYNGNIIKNNTIVLQDSAATGYAINTLSGNITTCDYNTFKTNNPSHAISIINGNAYTTANIIGGGGFNTHSLIEDPLLMGAPANCIPNAMCEKGIVSAITITGTGNGLVTTDIYGVTIGNPPQIGASEAGGALAIDAALKNFVLPAAFPVSAGLQDIAVRVKNAGSTTITSFSVSVQMGATTNTIFWTGSLVPCTDTLITFTGSNQFTLVTGSNTLKAWTASPNFVVDSNASNDTLVNTFCTTMGGTYLIDSAGNGNYLSFTQAANALGCGGINSPVVFNIRKGTYIEQPIFLTVQGASAVNSITFQSEAGNADSVNLQFNNGSANNWVLNLNGASFYKFRNMTISPLNASYGTAVFYQNGASSDSFYNVVFNGLTTTSNTTNLALVSQPSQTNISNYMSFDTCRFKNGAYGTYINSSSSSGAGQSSQTISINNCDFTNQYAYGIYNQYINGARLTNNRISTNSTLTSYYGMYNYWIMELAPINRCIITGNTITGSAGGYGMYNYYIGVNSSVTSNRGLIANNAVSVGTGANATVGIYDNNGNGLDYVNNSVNVGTSASGNASGAFVAPGASYGTNTLSNNVFSASNGATAVSITTLSLYTTVNYNNLYTTGTNLGYLGAVGYTSLASWRTASGKDANSISYRPGYTSSADLTPNPADTASWSLNGRANFTNLITTDIKGNARPQVVANGVPDIGAYEFTPTSTAPMCTSNLAAATAGTTQYFFFSLDTVASITWDPSFSTPSVIAVRQYSGVPPQHIAGTPMPNYMYFYTDLSTGSTSGFYSYTMGLYYRNTWMGTISNAANLRMATYSSSAFPNWTSWHTGTNSSSVNTGRNIITNINTGDLLLFTGSDSTAPLPVVLFDLSANRIKNNVVVNWSTASEKNSSLFEVERSFDGNQFAAAGQVKASGNSNAFVSYSFNDRNVVSLTSGNVIYYRLKMIDMDGKFEYSKTVTVRLNNALNDITVVMYPNPVSNNLYVKVNLPVSGNVKIELMDITGKTLMSRTQWMEAGSNVSGENVGNLSSGVYFLSTEINGEKQVQKLIKE